MAWIDRLDELADSRTISRGRAYADSGLVIELREQAGRISATARGTDDYRVELTADTFFCNCPVGVTGSFCKHCVAVAIEAAGDTGEERDAVSLDQFDAATTAWPEYRRAEDVARLGDEVKLAFTPRRRFYDYNGANDYAGAVEPTVRRLEDLSHRPAPATLLPVIQNAIGLVLRTILRSDDSSGLQSMQMSRLLDAHVRTAAGTKLTKAEARKLVRWLYTFMFDGKQDFFTVDIDRYAGAVGEHGIEQYRRLVDDADDDAHRSAVRHAHGRLAILSRDPDRIVEHFGSELTHALHFVQLVAALEQSGNPGLATEFARSGMTSHPQSPYLEPLVKRLVEDAAARGAVEDVVGIRRDDFRNRPSTTTYAALERAATTTGTWDTERAAADELLQNVDPRGRVRMLHRQGDHAAAWQAAESVPTKVDVELWTKLFRRQAKTDPAATLPHYRRLVQDSLVTSDRRNYRVAARLLRGMRDAAAAADRSDEFDGFLAEIREQNRHRPALGDELRRAGLAA